MLKSVLFVAGFSILGLSLAEAPEVMAKPKPKPAASKTKEADDDSDAKSSKKDSALFPDGGVTPAEMAVELKAAGHKAKAIKDKNSDTIIEASFPAGGQDVSYRVFFFGCKKGRCASAQYYVAFDGKKDKAIKWNEDNRYARAYVAGEQVHLEYDLDLEQGASHKLVKNSAERWKAIMVAAVNYIR